MIEEIVTGHLQPQEKIVIRELMDRVTVTDDQLIYALYGDDPDGGPLNVEGSIKVRMSFIRKKLIEGWRIGHVRAHVWQLTWKG